MKKSLFTCVVIAALAALSVTADANDCFDPGAMAREARAQAKKLALEKKIPESEPRVRTDLVELKGIQGGVDAKFRAAVIQNNASHAHKQELFWLALFEQKDCTSARLAIIGINKYKIMAAGKARVVYQKLPDEHDVRMPAAQLDGKADRITFEKLGDRQVKVTFDSQIQQQGCNGELKSHRVSLTEVVSWDFGKDPEEVPPSTQLALLSQKVAEEAADLAKACGASAGRFTASQNSKGELKDAEMISAVPAKSTASARDARPSSKNQ